MGKHLQVGEWRLNDIRMRPPSTLNPGTPRSRMKE